MFLVQEIEFKQKNNNYFYFIIEIVIIFNYINIINIAYFLN